MMNMLQAYGVHINGYTWEEDGLHMWLARRSNSKPTWPGMLDHIVAGGQVLLYLFCLPRQHSHYFFVVNVVLTLLPASPAFLNMHRSQR